ncbi:MAG: hypothetical protein KDC98_15385 [Planctomycetes bacterium]|nr:hypothetical protein [Planctomycetota bacterium]
MQSLLESTWQNVEPVLRSRVGAAAFESWLAPLRPLAMERGTLHFEAPSRLIAERVEQFHRALLEAELSREFGTAIRVSIQARPDVLGRSELEVGPTQPIVDPSNRTAWLVLQALREGRPLPANLFLFHGTRGTGKTFLLAAWRAIRSRGAVPAAAHRSAQVKSPGDRSGNRIRDHLDQLGLGERGAAGLDPVDAARAMHAGAAGSVGSVGDAPAQRPAERLRVPQILEFDGPRLIRAFQVAIREQRVEGFVEELCADRDLLVDEVHRLAGHERIQREFAKVLERRADLVHPTLLASRHHPHDIRDLEPGLATWMLSGFVTRLEEPGPEARLAYLRALEGPRSQNGRADAIERLAREVKGGYPELKRAWLIDRHARPELQRHYFELIDPRSTFERIRDEIVERYDVPVDELVGSSQRRRVSHARKVLSWLCVQDGLSRAEVGRYMGRTRAAISYAIKSLEKDMDDDPALRRELEGLR